MRRSGGLLTREELDELSDNLGVKVFTRLPKRKRDEHGDGRSIAGTYELTADSWDELVVVVSNHPVTGQPVEVEHFVRHEKGDLVHLTDAQARRLLAAEAVVNPGEREAALASSPEATIDAARRDLQAMEDRKRHLQSVAEAGGGDEEQWDAGKAPAGGAEQ